MNLAFSDSVFQLVQFASLAEFADWHPGLRERLARRLLPPLPRLGSDAGVPEFDALYQECGRWTMLDRFRAGMLARLFESCLGLEGDVVECGTGPGGISLMLARLIRARKLRKRLWVFDSFEGLPAPDRSVDREYQAGACAYSLARVQGLLRDHAVEDLVKLEKGWLADTLPQLPRETTFCFVHVDVDLYGSVNDAVTHLYPRLVPGGVMVFDDYYDGSGGVFKAVNEAAQMLGQVVQLGPTCQAFWVKGEPAEASWTVHATRRDGAPLLVPASLARLARYVSYVGYLREVRAGLSLARRFALGRLAPRLLQHPLSAVRASLDSYLGMLGEAPPQVGTSFLLEPHGRLVRGTVTAR